jgi:hypothetical protein
MVGSVAYIKSIGNNSAKMGIYENTVFLFFFIKVKIVEYTTHETNKCTKVWYKKKKIVGKEQSALLDMLYDFADIC